MTQAPLCSPQVLTSLQTQCNNSFEKYLSDMIQAYLLLIYYHLLFIQGLFYYFLETGSHVGQAGLTFAM